MILADTSVWINHIRSPDPVLSDLLGQDAIIMHPYVIGEIALGSIKDRRVLVARLAELSVCDVATHDEVMLLVERHRLFGRGIGYVDAHLLAATLLTSGTRLWTRDRRLGAVAQNIGIAA